ncbi:hypothetical protein [uncultured Eubacterium sp.]|uniref:hypothetical protein n=1 Tax=uncultured Eubacterium sp. TaxID=165185 RepID=UPI0025FD4A77|nr:hypothetical protein [uncultured Eubacterium sp.]
MKNKKVFAIILAIIVAIAVGIVVYMTNSSKQDETPNATISQTAKTEATVSTTAPVSKESEVVATEAGSTKNESTEVPKSVQGKYWYLFDDKKQTAYAFQFDKNNQVNIAYFGEETISGLDAEYTKGYCAYSYSDGKISIKEMPDQFPDSSFDFKVKKGKVVYGKAELEAMKDLSLDNALTHFE